MTWILPVLLFFRCLSSTYVLQFLIEFTVGCVLGVEDTLYFSVAKVFFLRQDNVGDKILETNSKEYNLSLIDTDLRVPDPLFDHQHEYYTMKQQPKQSASNYMAKLTNMGMGSYLTTI